MENYIELEKEIVDIVKSASELMTERDFTVERKSTLSDIVTSCDISVQKFLCEELGKLLPSSGFLCEEINYKDLNHEYIWIIDPIDGTTNYSRALNICAVSVALVRNRKPVIGVVYNPFRDELFSAIAGRGATYNGKPIKVSDRPFEDSLLCTAMSLYNKKFAPVCLDIISEAYEQCNDIRRLGSCAVELCYIAAGKCDLYFEIRVFPWDYAAAFLILKEAGGILKGWNDEEPTFDKATVLVGANNEENYKKLSAIVNKHIKNMPYEEYI